jgi:acyl-CoA synthetase (AMP-forming)/AMP-acid ligase II/acyl carrier protein
MDIDTPPHAATTADVRFPAQGAGEAGLRAANLVEVFRRRASAHPHATALTFLAGPESAPEDRSYAQLDVQARAIAAELQRLAAPGQRALLMYDAGLDYVAALAGCLYAGIVAVPVFPPDPLRATRVLPRLEAIVNDAQATLVLGTASDLAWAGALLGKMPGVRSLVSSDTVDTCRAGDWRAPELDRATPAFLQYTSGSTGLPKGVLIRHGNVLANLAQMEQLLDVPDAVACLWLPAYHDMGLVGGILQCWYSGRHNHMLSPLAFFQQPLRWLRAVADYRATSIAAPDFAYDLCVRKIKPEERKNLDLSCLRIAMSGAEPVRAATIDRFVEAFRVCGVQREIFCPCYGMAEATLLVTASKVGAAPVVRSYDALQISQNYAARVEAASDAALTLVSCGRPPAGQRVAIVDRETRITLPERQVGEIWVSGANIATEYWGRPAESQATFRAFTADGKGPFLRTGDLGFIDGGELFISGRCKDLIIIRGRNYHPQDIEPSVEQCHAALRPRAGAAFSIDKDGREQLIIAYEVARPKKVDLAEVARAVRRAVLEDHDLIVDAVVLIRAGTIPKTTSGKIQRHLCREQFLACELDIVHAWESADDAALAIGYVPPRNELESELVTAWAEVLGVERVGVFDSFFDLGGNSLMATQLVSRLAPRFGVEVPLADLFDRPTIAALAELIMARRAALDAADAELLNRLEGLSEAETAALLARAENGHTTTPLHTDGSPAAHATHNGLASLSTDGEAAQARTAQH